MFIHMPIFSSGSKHGDNERLKQKLYSLASEFAVDVVFTGHEHIMSHYSGAFGSPYVEMDRDKNYRCSTTPFYIAGEKIETKKGERFHEVLMGASGHSLSELCPGKNTTMA